MVLGKKVAMFNWEWGRNSAPREGQKMPCLYVCWVIFIAFVNINFSKNSFRITIKVSNRAATFTKFGKRLHEFQ